MADIGTKAASKPKSFKTKYRTTKALISSNALRCNDLLFVTEYLRNGRNGVKAYQAVHPNSKYTSSEVSAHRLLSKARIQQEIAQRIQHEAGITKQGIEASLLKYQAWAEDKRDYVSAAQIAMDCAKLAGLLVDKKQDVPPVKELSQDELTSALRARGYAAVPQQDSN